VVKDRVLGHNPVAALYGVKVYFQRVIKPLEKAGGMNSVEAIKIRGKATRPQE
jgi:hypothetical protein